LTLDGSLKFRKNRFVSSVTRAALLVSSISLTFYPFPCAGAGEIVWAIQLWEQRSPSYISESFLHAALRPTLTQYGR